VVSIFVGNCTAQSEHTFRLKVDKVPKVVMCTLSLRNLVVRLGLDGMHKVGELHCILNEEHRNIVADDIPVTFVGVKLGGETTDVADSVLSMT
jgi:hypothetical protein